MGCGAALAVCEAMEAHPNPTRTPIPTSTPIPSRTPTPTPEQAMEAHPNDARLQREASLVVRWLGGEEASASASP